MSELCGALVVGVVVCATILLVAAVAHLLEAEHQPTLRALAQAVRALEVAVVKEGRTMALSLEALRAEVERNTTVDGSAIVLLQGLIAKIEELIAASGNTVDPAELTALVDGLKGSTDALAAAVAANTPTP